MVGAAVVVAAGRSAGWHGEVAYSLLAIVLVAGGGPLVLAGLASDRRRDHLDPAGPDGSVTAVIRVGAEPPEVARATVMLAARTGPVVVIGGPDGVPDDIAELGVAVAAGSTFEESLRSAAAMITTDAVLLTSARAVPLTDRCRLAAGLLGDDVGWAVGNVGAMNDDGYLDDRARRLETQRRFDARAAGLDLWEPDATLVRTDLLREVAIESGRPWGRLLRELRARGVRGRHLEGETFALRCSPTAERAYWPDTIGRQRAAAADAADAVCAGSAPVTRRLVAAAVLSGDLFAFRALLVGAALVALASSPYEGWRFGHVTTSAVVGTIVVARWLASRRVAGAALRPLGDLLAALHRVPGSVSAAVPALTRRIRPPRVPVPSRPLLWGALLLTALAGARLVDQSADSGAPTTSIAASVATLVLLWVFGVRALMRRSWERSAFRVPLRLPATVGRRRGRVVDGSPLGMSVSVKSSSATVGTRVRVRVQLDDGSKFRTTGRLTSTRTTDGRATLGLALEPDDDSLGLWLAQLLRSAERRDRSLAASARPLSPPRTERRLVRWSDRVAVAVGAAASLATVAALVLVLSGYRPLVVRSGSMSPTLEVGDLVVAQPTPAALLRRDDIVTVPASVVAGSAPRGESLTHRVRALEVTGTVVQVTSRGDANRTGETWSVATDDELRRAAWSIPRIGAPAVLLRAPGVAAALLAVAVGLLLVPLAGRAMRGFARPAPIGAGAQASR